MLSKFAFLLCFPAALLAFFGKNEAPGGFSKQPPAAWVQPSTFSLEPIPLKPSQVNVQHLLIDTQRNWEEKTTYYHRAIKVLTQNGVEHISQLKIDFNPSYQNIVMHAIRLFRDGEWVDRLEKSRHNVLQREEELEQNIYNGRRTLVYFLEDVREGDIIEYAYSYRGRLPLFDSHYMDAVYLQRGSAAEKLVYRVLMHPKHQFFIKAVNTTIEPRITDLSSSMREWLWEASATPTRLYESYEPGWYNPDARIQMSAYKSWQEVVETIAPLYVLPKDLCPSPPS